MMDSSSNSNADEAIVTHLEWCATIDFERRVIQAKATYTVKGLKPNITRVCLDTSKLEIHSIVHNDGGNLKHKLHPVNNAKIYLGQKLEIQLPSPQKFSIVYQVTNQSTAVQWLPPPQTAGKQHPYLFTQCQAIHARALVPCQDQPGVKITYKAIVTVPAWATCVMSALPTAESSPLTTDNSQQKVFHFEQPVAISSYLLAIAVGDIVKKDISDRCAVWSEPSVVEAAAFEFSQTEEFLQIAESIAGRAYEWGRYDLLCLPPSFPYGGMENPCLTFVTPTLLAGDRSLADTVAHEIAHSWTGNLVTNATWDHFWLNEGWTVWFQRKIMCKIKRNSKFLDFDAIGGRKALSDAVERMAKKNCRLVLNIGDDDPDDTYSKVAYEKGFTFLLYLEQMVSSDRFEDFFKAYIKAFASKTLSSDDFRGFFMDHFKGICPDINQIDWEEWLYGEGMPPILPPLDQKMAEDSNALASLWADVNRGGKNPPVANSTRDWSSQQMVCFLDALQSQIGQHEIKVTTTTALNALYRLGQTHNAEIFFRYCILAIQAEDESILPVAVRLATTQGRMKFTRPIYRALYESKMGKEIALSTFLNHKDFYHPICSKMVAQDLHMIGSTSVGDAFWRKERNWIFVGTVAGLVGVAVTLVRSQKRS